MALLMRTQLRSSANEVLISPIAYKRARHDPRHGRWCSSSGADPRRLSPTTSCAHDRRARHGVPAAERGLELVLRCSAGALPDAQLLRRRRAADTGWTAYPPLSIQAPGNGQDYWILSLHLLTVSTCRSGQLPRDDPQHAHARHDMDALPLFVWSIELYAWLIMAVMPVCAAADYPASRPLDLHRRLGHQTDFFNPGRRRLGVLYQHAFWFFGHPEVTSSCCPAFGMIWRSFPSSPASRIFGYKAIVASTVAIGFFSMLVWAHHMFTVGCRSRCRRGS
jgi:heme/copper-type cytochrome/quinol oxidase subunit 1